MNFIIKFSIEWNKENTIEKDKNKNINNNNNNYNIFQNQELNPSIQNYIDNRIEDEINKLKIFIHEEINTLHVDLIKQFEIQQNQMMEILRNNSLLNSKMAIEIEKLKRENENLKSQYF
jgi:protein NEDD1